MNRNYKRCVVCGQDFAAPPSSEKICCSPECSHIWRTHRTQAGIYDKSIHMANTISRSNPRMQRGEQNINAKSWRIQAPNGEIFECINLLDWFRNHADLIDGTPQQAWDGVTKIKYSMQGKRKHPSFQWKGWKLLAWGDERNHSMR